MTNPSVEAGIPTRWGAFLRDTYGTDNPGRIIRDFSQGDQTLTHRTVRNWLRGETGPSASNLLRAVELHGLRVLSVLKPESRELRMLAARDAMGDLKAALREVARLIDLHGDGP